MDHLSAAGSSATRNLTTTEPSESLNRRKTVDFRFQRPHATSRSFFFNKPMRAMDSRRDFTSKKVFSGYFSELGEKANSALLTSVAFVSWNFTDYVSTHASAWPFVWETIASGTPAIYWTCRKRWDSADEVASEGCGWTHPFDLLLSRILTSCAEQELHLRQEDAYSDGIK